MEMAEAETYEGPVTITRKGFGFFVVPAAPLESSAKKGPREDLIIPPEWTNHALTGDIVRVISSGTYRDPAGVFPPRAGGKIIEIVSRARETFVGTLSEEAGAILLTPDFKKMHIPIAVHDLHGARIGDKVLVRMKGWEEGALYPWGIVETVIGKAGEHETEMRALVLGQGFSTEFPPDVTVEAKRLEAEGRTILEQEVAARIARNPRADFRGVSTCTIDPANAKDFDDALSVRPLKDGTVEVGIHIADVSFFVRPDSALDREARERATSIYLVDRTVPMLPEILSNGLCSLNPNEDRLAVSAVFTLDANANIVSQWFGETVIRSDKRFTYEEAQTVLDTSAGTLHHELAILRTFAQKIRERRQAAGAVEFDTAEVKVTLDAAGRPIAITLKERKETNLLIEDFMLLANEAVAKHLSALLEKGAHALSLYRVHDTPDPERIENLTHLLRVMGYTLKAPAGRVTGAELNKLIEAVKGKPEEYLVKTAVLRSMAKAVYATENIGHFGLGFDYYTHFTSPIRRYPDLIVHRLVKAHAPAGTRITKEEMSAFDAIAQHASEREVAAADAERDSIKMKQVEFLAPHIGETFEVVISGVTDRGLYVEEKETHADGMIRISDVGDDYFDYDEKHYRLIGRRTHRTFQLGDPIHAKLIAARIPEKELDFVPA